MTDELTLTNPSEVANPADVHDAIQAGALIDHYEIIRPLGRGGMGEVWLGRDVRLGRSVALKFLRTAKQSLVRRFVDEARTTAWLTHENIVSLYDVGEHKGVLYMVLEYVRGWSLRQWVTERATEADESALGLVVPARKVVELMIPVARALVHAHEAGVIHRDLKLANIMLTDSGKIKVLDFGIAKLMAGSNASRDGLVMSNEVSDSRALVGTVAYMSPEQMRQEEVDYQSDIWAMGIMLHVLAIGSHPLGTLEQPPSLDDLVSVTDLTLPMPSVQVLHPELGRLAAIIDRCLVKRKEDRLGSARELLAELEAMSPSPSRRADDEAPYPGLASFQTRDADRFFGRDRLVAQAVNRIAEQRLLAVLGPSGAGKSSFVRAGLLPALNRGNEAWQALVLRPGPHPLTALAELILRHVVHDTGDSSSALDAPESSSSGYPSRDALCQRLQAEPGHLGALLGARARRRRERILLFCDQFEEAFTLGSVGERTAFFASLCAVVDDVLSPVRVVVAMRSDFLDRLTEVPMLAEFVGPAVFLLGPMTRDELRSALVEPVRRVDHDFESEGMVTEMVDALAGTAAALPLLQFTAARLWDSRDRQRRVLTLESYRGMGGVAGALASHADAVLAAMSSAEKRAARAVLLRLVTTERTRALVPMSELTELFSSFGAHIESVVERLVDARLLAIETGDTREDRMVELVHESLLDRWEKLRTWIDEEQHDARFLAELRSAAAQWESNGRAEGFLWRDEAARRARDWALAHKNDGTIPVGSKVYSYIEAVVALAERTKRLRRGIVVGVFSATVLITVVVAFLALAAMRQASAAMRETQRADEQARRAEGHAKLAQDDARWARNAMRMGVAAREVTHDATTALALLRELEPGSVPQGWAALALWAHGTDVARRVMTHDNEVTAAAYSPDGRRIAAASRDGTVWIWSVDEQRAAIVLRGHEERVTSVAFSPDSRRVASASWDKTVRVWGADGEGVPLVLRGHEGRVDSAAFNPDGLHIVSASQDGSIRIWSSSGQGSSFVLGRHDAEVYSAVYSRDGKRIASGSHDKTVRVWDPLGRGAPLVLQGHESTVFSVAFSPDGKHIVSSSRDQTLRVWNASGQGEPVVLRGHDNLVWSAAFSPDGQRIVSASFDKTVRVWDVGGRKKPDILLAHDAYIFTAVFSPDGQHVLSGAADGTLRTWNVNEQGKVVTIRGHDGPVLTAAFSPDGMRVVSASQDKTVRVWSTGGRSEPIVLRGHKSHVSAAVFSGDGERIVSASWDNTLRVWRADGQGQPLVLRGHSAPVFAVAFSSDSRRIVSGAFDGTVRVWNADGTGEPIVLRADDHGKVLGVAFSPDGTRIVSAHADNHLRVWDAGGGGAPLVFRGHTLSPYSAMFSPDGRHIVSAAEDTTVRLWRVDGSAETLVFRGHESVAFVRGDRPFSPDGRRIVSSSNDGTVRIWNADNSGEPIVLRGGGAPINSASWSPDGKHIVAALDDHRILVWTVPEPLTGPGDVRLWTATSYCMPLDVRLRLLGFSKAQSQADLDRCQRRMKETAAAPH